MSLSGSAIKLRDKSLPELGNAIQKPRYDRTALLQNTVHIGVGGFHRAHQAMYLDDLLSHTDTERWGECGIGILQSDARMRDALKSQDCLYTLVERSADRQTARVIGSMADYLYAPEDKEAVIEKMAAADTKIVSLTITEGGYFIDDATGDFLADHPDIQHDLRNPHRPVSSLGYIVEALHRRRQRGLIPFTVMSCDNLQGNGHVIRRVLLEFAGRVNPALHQWISTNVAFPNSMVDRITPGTTANDIVSVRDRFGIDDAWPVVTEPFIQWVIEDEFCNGRPQWERCTGVTLVSDVTPYELMKMRLLNGSHLAMAYTGALVGYPLVHQVMEDPVFITFIERFMEEVTPVVPVIPGVDVTQYKKTLMERFSNPTINDQVTRLCSEGSAKMPKWVVPSIVELLEQKRPVTLLSFVIAAWIRYFEQGIDEKGEKLDIIDARAEELKAAAANIGEDPMPMLRIRSIFGPVLPENPTFVQQVRDWLKTFAQQGVTDTMRQQFSKQ